MGNAESFTQFFLGILGLGKEALPKHQSQGLVMHLGTMYEMLWEHQPHIPTSSHAEGCLCPAHPLWPFAT